MSSIHQRGFCYILWYEGLEEESAILFLSTLRRFGFSARQLGLHLRPTRGRYGSILTPDLSLDEALPLASQVDCLIIPGSLKHLQCHHDPRLQQFLKIVCQSARWLVLRMDDLESDLLCDQDRKATLYGYLPGPDLPYFAYALAENLLAHKPLSHPHIDAFSEQKQFIPGPIRVLADSQPPLVAGAIANSLRNQAITQVRATGARAVYKSVRAMILARQYLITDNLDVQILPSSITANVLHSEEHSAIHFDIRTIPRSVS